MLKSTYKGRIAKFVYFQFPVKDRVIPKTL